MDDIFPSLVAFSAGKVISSAFIRTFGRGKFERVGTVSQLNIYPVKSCRGISLSSATCLQLGIHHDDVTDRTWMITRPNGDFLTQRQQPRMALINVSNHENHIHLDAPEMPTLKLPKNPKVEEKNTSMCRVWDLTLPGLSCGDEADRWASEFLKVQDLHVVFSAPNMPKKDASDSDISPLSNPALPGDKSAFADMCPYLVTTKESLEDLNKRLTKPVPSANFRPNIVIKGVKEPFDEDNWSEIRFGEKFTMRCLHGCRRCLMPTVDINTGVKDPSREPRVTLQTYRCKPGIGDDPFFGINAATDLSGTVNVGDPVFAIRKH